jgi:hypothetical protein
MQCPVCGCDTAGAHDTAGPCPNRRGGEKILGALLGANFSFARGPNAHFGPTAEVCHYMIQPLVELYGGCMVVLKVS